ncbi:MAG TPA: SurA N-terminal domain-containing protein [Alphaproteobacteria bacterium]|nr:SurA N-terminal domain-containing protein [Alphaproteobacteria bacterium]
MPEQTKYTLKTIVARIIVSVMFGMLILSFAIWGIGDIFRRGIRTQSVAEVGSQRIMPQEFQDQYRRELRRLQTMLQTEITAERAREVGLPQRVLREMIGRVLFDLAARDAGVAVSDEVVRQTIFDNVSFRNAEGKFDRGIFQTLLNNAGYTEDGFVALTRQDIVRSQVSEAITAGGAVPQVLLDDLYRYRDERRTAETVLVSAAAMTDIPSPSDADLEAYHKDHAEAFTAPEYRALTAVAMTPDDLAARMAVSEDKLKDEYEARLADFKILEQRTLRQMILKDEAGAKDAAARIAKGESFDKVADELTGKPPLDLGTVKQADVPMPELAAAAFEIQEGAVTEPVQTPLGWHIAEVVKIISGHTESFEEAKGKLTHELQLREASDAIYDLGNKLQDALGGGASLEEAAQKLDFKVVKIAAVDGKGLSPEGKPVAGLPQGPKFLSTAFSTDAGRDSELTEDNQGGFFIVHVDKVVPSQLRPLADVRDKVLAGWQADARRKAAAKAAQAMVEKARSGADLAALAKESGASVSTTAPFIRTGQGAGPQLPPELVASLFAAKIGDVVSSASPQGAIVAKLAAVIPADAKADAAGVNQLEDQLRGTLDADLLNAFTDALRERYGVEIDEHVVDSLVGS